MKGAALVYLNLAGQQRQGADDWTKAACALDDDGFYRTPLRCALSSIRDPWMRRFLHDLIPNAMLSPSAVAQVHGIPHVVEGLVMRFCLMNLWRECQAAPYRPSWVDQSLSQQNAVLAGEAVA